MKDTIITAKFKKRELWILLCCFAAANLINLGAIITYGTRWIEVLSQIGYVVCITVILYCLIAVLRIAVCALFCKKKK